MKPKRRKKQHTNVGVVLRRFARLLTTDGDLQHTSSDEAGVSKDLLELEAVWVSGHRSILEEMGREGDSWKKEERESVGSARGSKDEDMYM